MTHLTSDELIDAMEGLLAPERQAHLAACDACQRQLTELADVLAEARQVSTPEPSPLFWQHFSERVRGAIDGAPAGGGWPSWVRWRVLAPLGAVAMLVAGVMMVSPRQSSIGEVARETPEANQASEAPESWVMLTDLVGEIDLDTASAAGVIEPGIAEQAVLQLTADEQRELSRLLRVELQRAKS
jgi:hypothetical protein